MARLCVAPPQAHRTERGEHQGQVTTTSGLRRVRHCSTQRATGQDTHGELKNARRHDQRRGPSTSEPDHHRAEHAEHHEREEADKRRCEHGGLQFALRQRKQRQAARINGVVLATECQGRKQPDREHDREQGHERFGPATRVLAGALENPVGPHHCRQDRHYERQQRSTPKGSTAEAVLQYARFDSDNGAYRSRSARL